MCLFCKTHLLFRYQHWVVQAHKFNHVPSLPFSISHTIQARNSHSTSSREIYLWRWSECVWQIVCVRVKSCNMCRVCSSRANQKLTYIHHLSSLFLISCCCWCWYHSNKKSPKWFVWPNFFKELSRSTLFLSISFEILSTCIMLIF